MRQLAFIVAYDIASSGRRARVARHLVARGARVQKSVFVCRLTPAGARRLSGALGRMIDAGADRIMIEPMAGRGFQTAGALVL